MDKEIKSILDTLKTGLSVNKIEYDINQKTQEATEHKIEGLQADLEALEYREEVIELGRQLLKDQITNIENEFGDPEPELENKWW